MMDRAMNELERASGRVAGDLRTVVTDGEDLLKAAAHVSGEGFAAARTTFEGKLKSARAALAGVSQPVFDRTRETAAAADDYVHGNPWTVICVAAAAGLAIGFLAARR